MRGLPVAAVAAFLVATGAALYVVDGDPVGYDPHGAQAPWSADGPVRAHRRAGALELDRGLVRGGIPVQNRSLRDPAVVLGAAPVAGPWRVLLSRWTGPDRLDPLGPETLAPGAADLLPVAVRVTGCRAVLGGRASELRAVPLLVRYRGRVRRVDVRLDEPIRVPC